MIKGLFTALVTPFDNSGHIHEAEFHRLIDFQLKAGVDGLVVLGTTGEAPTLSDNEQVALIKAARRLIPEQINLMVGTGSYSTKKTIELTQRAKDLGADCALIVSPYYNKPMPEGIYLHFKAIVEAVDLPIVVYNHPGRTGHNIPIETLLRIAELPNVCGIKECSGNLPYLMEILENIRLARPALSLMLGDDIFTFPGMSLGAHGVISVVGNIVPHQMKKLVQALAEGKSEEARHLHYELMPLFKLSGIETNPIAIKAMMESFGFSVGHCRLPLSPISSENKFKVESILQEISSLKTVR